MSEIINNSEKSNTFIYQKRAELIDYVAHTTKINMDLATTLVSDIIDKNLMSAYFCLETVSNKAQMISHILPKNKTIKVKDFLEPEKGYVATLSSTCVFDAVYTTPLRGGESYRIIFPTDVINPLLGYFSFSNLKASIIKALVENALNTEMTPIELNKVQKILTERFSLDKPLTFVQDVLDNRAKEAQHSKVDREEELALSIMKNYAVLNNHGSVKIIDTTKPALSISSLSDLRTLFANNKIEGKHVVDIWMASKKRALYTNTKFDPSLSEGVDDAYNLFKGFKHKAKKSIDITLFKEFVKEVICSHDEQMYNIVWSFIAQMLQEPTRKMGTALVLLSSKGTGKSTFVHVLGKLLAGYFIQTAENKRLIGEFNNHLVSTLLFYANELTFTDNKRVISKLKNIITETEFTYEIKGSKTYSAPNYTRLIIDSNEDYAVVQTADERRFTYPQISDAKIGDTEYFNNLYSLFEEEGFYESLMYDFMNYDYSEYIHFLKTPPKNEITQSQMLESFTAIDTWWLYCLEEGKLPSANYTVTYDNKLSISSEELYQSFRKYILRNGGRINNMDTGAFITAFKKHILRELDLNITHRPTINQQRVRLNIYETLPKQVEHFKKIKKLPTLDYDASDWRED